LVRSFCKTLYWLEVSAKKGNHFAQTQLGDFYRTGELVTQNYEEAFFWYLEAAINEYGKAQYYVGLFYHEGYGVEQDKERGLFWMLKSKDNGYVFANTFLQRQSKQSK